jgi:hypothetical protein
MTDSSEDPTMKRLPVLAMCCCLFAGQAPARAADSDREAAMDALKEFNDFIGSYKAFGAPARKDPKGEWGETISWGWKFKGNDAWMIMDVKDGKYFKSGELRYIADKEDYQFTAVDKKGQKLVFEGKMSKSGWLDLSRTDPKTKEVQQIKMSTNNDGARFIYEYWVKAAGRTTPTKGYQVAGAKEGESIGSKEKKNLCVVSGGIGTSTVSFGGKTYYVCCSGCREAFEENPAKYVKEFEAKQKK